MRKCNKQYKCFVHAPEEKIYIILVMMSSTVEHREMCVDELQTSIFILYFFVNTPSEKHSQPLQIFCIFSRWLIPFELSSSLM
jgi:hypothetical protein